MNCKHIYQESDSDICGECDRPTHKTDWIKVGIQRKEWIESGKATYGGWWSI